MNAAAMNRFPASRILRPALIGGTAAGALSGLPVIQCLCCLWIVAGAALAVALAAKDAPEPLRSGDGALVSAASGIAAAVVHSLVNIPFQTVHLAFFRRIFEQPRRIRPAPARGLAGPSEPDGAGIVQPDRLSPRASHFRRRLRRVRRARRDHRGGAFRKAARPAPGRAAPIRSAAPPPAMKLLKTQVIVNPESAKGQTRKRWSQIRDGIRHFIRDFKYEFTEKPLDAIDLARAAIKDGTELVIGVGGDGTMNEIANGFYEDQRIINPAATLGIVPSGTGCDLTRSLNIPNRLREAMTVITQAPSQSMDVGKVAFRAQGGEPAERFFLNVADFGVGGEVVARVNQKRLERKTSSYVRCLVSTMIKYKAKRVRIRVDGASRCPREEYLIGAIANGRIFGKGMKIAPLARLDDGLFDVVFVKGMKFLEFCANGWQLMNGTHLDHPKISLIQARRIEAEPDSGDPVLLELDGEQLGTLPATSSRWSPEACPSRAIFRTAGDRWSRPDRPGGDSSTAFSPVRGIVVFRGSRAAGGGAKSIRSP